MATVHNPLGAHIVEASSRLIPEPGFTTEQMLADAKLSGYQELILNEDGSVTVIWYKEKIDD